MNYDFTLEKKSNTDLKKELRRKKAELFRQVPSIIASGILIIVVLMTFADFQFTNIFTVGFAAQSFTFVLLSYIMYYVEKVNGKRSGCMNETYQSKKREHEAKSSKALAESDENDLPDFCEWWSNWELEKAQRNILAGSGLTYDEWKRYAPLGKTAALVTVPVKKLDKMLEKEKISLADYELIRQIKTLPAGKRVASVHACLVMKRHISAYDILYQSSDREKRDPVPRRLKDIERKHDAGSLIPLTVMMMGMLLIVPEVIGVGISLKAILYGLMRLVSMLFTAFKGNYNGETLYTVDAIENLNVQLNMLNLFDIWRDRK